MKSGAASGAEREYVLLYVDDIYHDPSRQVYEDICHFVSDTSLAELHAIVAHLGLRREWFHIRDFPHYLLTPNKREQVLRSGVKATTEVEVARLASKILMCAVVTNRPCTAQAGGHCQNPQCDFPNGRPICKRHRYLVTPLWSLATKPQPVCLRCVRLPELRAARAYVLGNL